MRKHALALLEEQSQKEHIDLYYADESGISSEGYVPYGWQFSDEQVCIASAKGQTLNCFALISRKNQIAMPSASKVLPLTSLSGNLMNSPGPLRSLRW